MYVFHELYLHCQMWLVTSQTLTDGRSTLGVAFARMTAPRNAFRVTTLKLDNDLSLPMVFIPGGSFWMGSPVDEAGRLYPEGPQHSVTIPSFYRGRYPVTQAQWGTISIAPPVTRLLDPDPSHFKGDARPVEQVSWHEAVPLDFGRSHEYRFSPKPEGSYLDLLIHKLNLL